MKKILYLITFMVMLMIPTLLTSCDHHRSKDCDSVLADSALVEALVEQVCNPEFEDVSAFTNYVGDEIRYTEFINTAKTLDPHTISFVASAVVDKKIRLNWSSWLDEFMTNKDHYLLLDKNNRLNFSDRFDVYKSLEVPPTNQDTICVQ